MPSKRPVRRFMRWNLLILLFLPSIALTTQRSSTMSDYLVYVGTYSSGDEDGIHVYRLDMATGALAHQSSIGGIDNPSFLDIAPNRRFLYAIGEVGAVGDRPGGAVAAFAIDQQSGALTHINTESTVGPGPCHISIDRAGEYALVANYGGGSVAILPIREDGSLGAATDFIQHEGSSVNRGRQEGPHAHSIMVSPNNRHAFAPDLGIDKVLIYAIDHDEGSSAHKRPRKSPPVAAHATSPSTPTANAPTSLTS